APRVSCVSSLCGCGCVRLWCDASSGPVSCWLLASQTISESVCEDDAPSLTPAERSCETCLLLVQPRLKLLFLLYPCAVRPSTLLLSVTPLQTQSPGSPETRSPAIFSGHHRHVKLYVC